MPSGWYEAFTWQNIQLGCWLSWIVQVLCSLCGMTRWVRNWLGWWLWGSLPLQATLNRRRIWWVGSAQRDTCQRNVYTWSCFTEGPDIGAVYRVHSEQQLHECRGWSSSMDAGVVCDQHRSIHWCGGHWLYKNLQQCSHTSVASQQLEGKAQTLQDRNSNCVTTAYYIHLASQNLQWCGTLEVESWSRGPINIQTRCKM